MILQLTSSYLLLRFITENQKKRVIRIYSDAQNANIIKLINVRHWNAELRHSETSESFFSVFVTSQFTKRFFCVVSVFVVWRVCEKISKQNARMLRSSYTRKYNDNGRLFTWFYICFSCSFFACYKCTSLF